MVELTPEQLARVAAFKDAVDITQARMDSHKRFGPRLGVIEAMEEILIFLQAELGRAEKGLSVPGSPGSKSVVMRTGV